MSTTDTMTHLIDLLETKVDWNKVFGVVEDLYNDPGFTSRADNFIVSSSVELALSEFSPLFRVDQIGYDFICEGTDAAGAEITVIGEYTGEAVELKMRKKLFYSPRGKNPHNTQDVKMVGNQMITKFLLLMMKLHGLVIMKREMVSSQSFNWETITNVTLEK